MIVGGHERGLDLTDLAEGFRTSEQSIQKVLLIGQSARRTAENLESAGFTNFTMSTATEMNAIVREATALAQPGDAVVLSPGFASFDMFKNYQARGEQFKKFANKFYE